MAKKNHRKRHSIKSFFEKHTDPEKREKLKAIRTDMEEKKKEILNLVHNEGEKDESKREPLAELIEDFHRQYESLYAHYDHLTGELKQKVHKKHQDKDNSSTSDSSSDSDSDHSSEEKGTKNGKLEDEIHKATDGLHQELEAAKVEVALLKNKLAAVCLEKDTLESDYGAVLSKLEGSDRKVENLTEEAGRWNSEKSELLAEKDNLISQLDNSLKTELELKQQIDELIRDKDNIAIEKEDAVRRLEKGSQNAEILKAEVEQLQGERQHLELELETMRQEVSLLRLELDSAKEETVRLNESVKAAEEENKSLSLKNSKITDELKQTQDSVEELKAVTTNSKQILAERERDFSSLQEVHTAHTTGASEQIKALEEQTSSLKIELDTLVGEKTVIEEQLESKVIEARQLGEEVSALRAQISEVEIISKEREEQISSLRNMLEVHENESNTRVEALTTQVNDFIQKVEELCAEKSRVEEQMAEKSGEASAQIKELQDRISDLEHDLNTLQVEDREMKLELERKTEDIADYLMQIEGLHEKLSSSDKLLKQFLDEKEVLAAKLKDRESEVELLNSHKTGLEEQTRTRSDEATQQREEIERLQNRIVELERAMQEREDESSAIQRRLEDEVNEASSKISALVLEINTLRPELEAVQTIKSQLEAQNEKEVLEYSESLKLLENENIALKSKIEDQLKMVQELEDALNIKREQYEQLEGHVQETKADLEAAERKIERLTRDLSMNAESTDESVAELERTIEDLKRDVETAEDEANTALEKTRTIEVQLRLANQKLRITEQLLTEKEEDYKIAEKKFHEDCKQLENRITRLSRVLAANSEAYRGMIMNISDNVNDSLAGMETIAKKFEEDHEKYSSNIYKMSEEIQILKHCAVGKNIEREQLEQQLSNLTEQLQYEREQGLMMKANISKLEVEADNDKGEKEKLLAALSQLKKAAGEQDVALKEKSERLTSLEDEKREAIRQLCLWSDNLRSRYDELKDKISKSSSQRR